jgi:ribosome biogenesis protein
MESIEHNAPSIRIRFATKDGRYAIPDNAPILVPASFRRLGLSSLVNNLLEHEQPVPFDFIIRGTYLRTTLDDFLAENGISSETIIDAEYTPAQKPPRYVASFEHDDWVSAVDTLTSSQTQNQQSRILSASYDGHLRIWNSSTQVLATSPPKTSGGHISFIRDAKFISPTQIASVGFDRVVRIWKYDESPDSLSGSITPKLQLCGHASSIDGLATSPLNPSRLLTASADHAIGVWSVSKSSAPPAPENSIPGQPSSKRRKLNSSVSVPQKGPLSLLQGHTQQVSSVIFDSSDATVAYSASYDQSMRTWDLTTSTEVSTRSTNAALLSIAHIPSLSLIATGTATRDIKLIDPRAGASAVTAMRLLGHRNSVVSLSLNPARGYNLVSGAHDGTVRIWDLRSTKQGKEGTVAQSSYTIQRQSLGGKVKADDVGSGAQVYAVKWDEELGVLSAGQDKMVQIDTVDGG